MHALNVLRVLARTERWGSLTNEERQQFLLDLDSAMKLPDVPTQERGWTRRMLARVAVPAAETAQNRAYVRAQAAAEAALATDTNYALEKVR